jgi:flagellar protein FlgJ
MTAAITDFSQFTRLRSGAERNDPEALREVARQFEALFLETILKNMRAGELAEPLTGESDQLDTYRGLMDQQLALDMARGRGIGFADMLVRQLGGDGDPPRPTSESLYSSKRSAAVLPAVAVARHPPLPPPASWDDPGRFVRDLWPHAERVARRLDVAPEGIVAQAALETGWGRHVMTGGDGASSHNLFGIKAGRDWPGSSVGRATLEYSDGLARRRVEQFRTYDDISDNFDDYARLIEANPRYSAVRGQGRDVAAFASALQDGGYATDPLYAAKIVRVLESETMQQALGGLKAE